MTQPYIFAGQTVPGRTAQQVRDATSISLLVGDIPGIHV